MPRPSNGRIGPEDPPPCERCEKPMEPARLTTGGPDGDPEVWLEYPVAVDTWACPRCTTFKYPRRPTRERVAEL